jgi:phosphohistidine phosphatase
MLLHLVRHAHAVREEEDATRPLSVRGRGEAARLAAFFAVNGAFRPAQIWHSPLRRSRQTADELIGRLGLDGVLLETPGLLPEDDPLALAERLESYPRDCGDLALVGHEPHLGLLASLLVRGKPKAGLFVLGKAASLTLESVEATHKCSGFRRWKIRWLVAPELLPSIDEPPAIYLAK